MTSIYAPCLRPVIQPACDLLHSSTSDLWSDDGSASRLDLVLLCSHPLNSPSQTFVRTFGTGSSLHLRGGIEGLKGLDELGEQLQKKLWFSVCCVSHHP